VGVTLTFALAGGLLGVFTARIPALVDKLMMSPSQLGTALCVWGAGAIVTMQALRFVMARVGSASVLRVAAPLYALSVVLVAFAPTYGLLLFEVAMFGMAFSAVEAAALAQGSTVEREYGRPLMNGMHAGWPIGAGVGGLSAAVCAQLGVSYAWSLAGAAAIAMPLAITLGVIALDTRQVVAGGRVRIRGQVRPVVYLFGLLAFAGFVLEGAVADWSGVLLHDNLGSSQAVAALAYPMFQGGMLTGRLGADRTRVRLGARVLVTSAGLATTACLLVATAVPQPLVVLLGVYGAGVAISPLLPLAVSLTGATDDPGHCDAAVAQLGVIGYAGMLAGPGIIGALADLVTLPTALGAVAVLLGSMIVAAGQLLRREYGTARILPTHPH
jgi:MFS family permease